MFNDFMEVSVMNPAVKDSLFSRLVEVLDDIVEEYEDEWWEKYDLGHDPELIERARSLLVDVECARAAEEERKAKSPYTQEFEQFWEAWPGSTGGFPNNTRKRGKGAAFRKWEQKRKEGVLPRLGELLVVLDTAKGSRAWREDDGQYIPMPATWLNQHGWDDEYVPASGGKYRS